MDKKYIIIAITLLLALTVRGADTRFTLVVDAGHGGHDTGAKGAFSREKDINLTVAMAFGRYVEQNCPDVKVVYTRRSDVFIPLQERANIANKANADLFVSVHTNAVPAGRTASGFETYTLGMHRAKENLDVAMRENSVISLEQDYQQRYQGFDPNSSESYIMFEFMQSANMEKSVELAKIIQRTVCRDAARIDKGVHQAGFLVLRQTSMPSCLVELGFITTPEEESFLNSSEGVDKMAYSLYKAFVDYKNKYSDKVVVPYAAPKKDSFGGVGRIVPVDIEVRNTDGKAGGKKSKPDRKETPKPDRKEAPKPADQETAKPAVLEESRIGQDRAGSRPIFMVQIFTVNRSLRPDSQQLKGHSEAVAHAEDGVVKYTIGSLDKYEDAVVLRKKLQADFPECFIVAYRNGERADLNQAILDSKK